MTYPIEEVVSYTSNIEGCGASQVQLCTDSECLALAERDSDLVSLSTNPTLKGTDGLIAPVLEIDLRNPFSKIFTLQGSNFGSIVKSEVQA